MHTLCPYCDQKIDLKMSNEDGKPDLSPLADHIDSAHPERSNHTITSKGYRTRMIPYSPIVFTDHGGNQ